MTDPMELVGLVEGRIGQDFDGECHLTADEARQIAACIREMVMALQIAEASMDARCAPAHQIALSEVRRAIGNDLPLPPAPGAEA